MSCDQLKPFRDIDGDIRHELGCPELFVLDLNSLRASMCLFLTRNRAGKTCISISRMVSIFLELFLKLEVLGQNRVGFVLNYLIKVSPELFVN